MLERQKRFINRAEHNFTITYSVTSGLHSLWLAYVCIMFQYILQLIQYRSSELDITRSIRDTRFSLADHFSEVVQAFR